MVGRSPLLLGRSCRSSHNVALLILFIAFGGFDWPLVSRKFQQYIASQLVNLIVGACTGCTSETGTVAIRGVSIVLRTVEHCQNSHTGVFHVLQIGQELGSDEKVLAGMIQWIVFWETARIGHDAAKDQSFISLVQALVDFVC